MAAQVTYRKQRIGQHLIGRGEGPDCSFRQTTYHFTKARKRLNNLVADCCFKPYIIPLAVAREKLSPHSFKNDVGCHFQSRSLNSILYLLIVGTFLYFTLDLQTFVCNCRHPASSIRSFIPYRKRRAFCKFFVTIPICLFS